MGVDRFKRHTYMPNDFVDFMSVMGKAMSGDMVFVIDPPEIFGTPPTSDAWSRTAEIRLETAAGEVHEWYNETRAAGVDIADDSVAGDATLTDGTEITFVNGVGVVEVNGDAADWLGGTRQVGTSEVDGGATTGSGILEVQYSDAEGDIDVLVPVADGDGITVVAERIGAVLAADPDVAARVTVEVAAALIQLTMVDPAAQDGAMDLTIEDADGTDCSVAAFVADTVTGVAPETVTLTAEAHADLLGFGVAAETQVETFITPA